MERVYRALLWLAVVTLVVGVVLGSIDVTRSASSAALQSDYISGTSGSVSFFFAVFFQTISQEFFALSVLDLLASGATIMAIALAWADRRRGWLIALLAVTLLTLLWPAGVVAWQAFAPTAPIAQAPYPITSPEGLANFTIFAVPFIPVVMALVLTLTRRQPVSPNAA